MKLFGKSSGEFFFTPVFMIPVIFQNEIFQDVVVHNLSIRKNALPSDL